MEPSFCFSCSSTVLLTYIQLVSPFLPVCCLVSTQCLYTPHLSLLKNVLFHFVSMMCFQYGKIYLRSNLALLPSLMSFAHLVPYYIFVLIPYSILESDLEILHRIKFRLNPCETLLTASLWLHSLWGFLEALPHPRIFCLSWPRFSSLFMSVMFKMYDTYCSCFAHKTYICGKLNWLDRQFRAEKGN